MNHRILGIVMALVALAASPCVRAVDWTIDGVALEGGLDDGHGHNGNATRVGGALVWDWGVKWFPVGNWYLGGQWEASFSYWDGDKGKTGVDSLYEFGITPVFRIQTDTPIFGIYPFVEGAIGAHVFSETEFTDRRFGINYSFGDHLGGGIRFGGKGQYELTYRYQHLSNAGLGEYNNGINFQLIRFVYHFR